MLKKDLIKENRYYKDKCKLLGDAVKDKINSSKSTDYAIFALFSYGIVMRLLIDVSRADGWGLTVLWSLIVTFSIVGLWVLIKGIIIRIKFVKEKKKAFNIKERLEYEEQEKHLKTFSIKSAGIIITSLMMITTVLLSELNELFSLMIVCIAALITMFGLWVAIKFLYQQFKYEEKKDKDLLR